MTLRRLVVLLAVGAVVAAPATGAPPAMAADGTIVVPAAPTVTAPGEYFQSMWQDRMDFSNAADFDTSARHMIQQGSANLTGGRLNMSGVREVCLVQ